jgi:hypothetical protein
MTRALLCTTLIAGLGLVGPAHAADEAARAAAKAKLEAGARLLDGGDYAQALERFEEAYRLVPSPKIFFNIGLAEVGLARNPDALRAFERFVAEAHDAAPSNLADARAQIDALLPKVAIVDVKCAEAGREIQIDGRSQGVTPLGAPIYLDPGRHQLVARGAAGTTPVLQDFGARAGNREVVTVLLPVVAGPAAAPPPASATPLAGAPAPAASVRAESPDAGGEARPLYRSPWLWAAVGAALVAGVVTVLVLRASPSYPDPTLGSHPGN